MKHSISLLSPREKKEPRMTQWRSCFTERVWSHGNFQPSACHSSRRLNFSSNAFVNQLLSRGRGFTNRLLLRLIAFNQNLSTRINKSAKRCPARSNPAGAHNIPQEAPNLLKRRGNPCNRLYPWSVPLVGKEVQAMPSGWDAHAAHTCKRLAATDAEERKSRTQNRFADHFLCGSLLSLGQPLKAKNHCKFALLHPIQSVGQTLQELQSELEDAHSRFFPSPSHEILLRTEAPCVLRSRQHFGQRASKVQSQWLTLTSIGLTTRLCRLASLTIVAGM